MRSGNPNPRTVAGKTWFKRVLCRTCLIYFKHAAFKPGYCSEKCWQEKR